MKNWWRPRFGEGLFPPKAMSVDWEKDKVSMNCSTKANLNPSEVSVSSTKISWALGFDFQMFFNHLFFHSFYHLNEHTFKLCKV